MLEKKIPIDIGVLCDLMDHLCASMIFAIRLRNANNTLHDIMLPKSWLLRLVPQCNILRTRVTLLSIVYIRNMRDLLEQVYTGDSFGKPPLPSHQYGIGTDSNASQS